MSSLFCCSHHLWKAEASEPTGHMRRRNKPHRKGQRLESLQNQVNVGEQRSTLVFLLINERIARNGTWTMLTRRFRPFEPFLNVRTVLTMHVYIPLCQGPKAASSSLMNLHPCYHFKWRCTLFWNSNFLFVQMSCALFKKAVFVFGFLGVFYTLSSFLPPFLLAHHRAEQQW